MFERGSEYARGWVGAPATGVRAGEVNPLWDYFSSHLSGHGIWKWEHYFEIYHRHNSWELP
jgi:hypothetical protein